MSVMALVRTSAANAGRDPSSWAPDGPSGDNLFGTFADANDPSTQAFLFTKNVAAVDGYLKPAVDLAIHQGLDCLWDEWTRRALASAMATRDLVSKRMLWLSLLVSLPAIEHWFVQHGPANAQKFVDHVRVELHAFCLGTTKDPGGNVAAAVERPAKRGRKASKSAETDVKETSPVYASVVDFVASMTAYYLAL